MYLSLFIVLRNQCAGPFLPGLATLLTPQMRLK